MREKRYKIKIRFTNNNNNFNQEIGSIPIRHLKKGGVSCTFCFKCRCALPFFATSTVTIFSKYFAFYLQRKTEILYLYDSFIISQNLPHPCKQQVQQQYYVFQITMHFPFENHSRMAHFLTSEFLSLRRYLHYNVNRD